MTDPKTHEELAAMAVEAFNSGDLDALTELLHPEIEIFTPPELVNSGTFHGPDGFHTWLADWLDAWEEFEVRIVSIETLGERFAIAAVHQHGRGKGSGLEIDMPIAHLWEIEDGLILRFQLHPTVEQARAAVELLSAQRGR